MNHLRALPKSKALKPLAFLAAWFCASQSFACLVWLGTGFIPGSAVTDLGACIETAGRLRVSSNPTGWLPIIWSNCAATPPFTFTNATTNVTPCCFKVLLGP